MSDELIDEMVAAATAAITPVAEQAYERAEAELGTLNKLLEMVTENEVSEKRVRGLQLLQRLTRPVLVDVAVEIVRAIEDSAGDRHEFAASAESLAALPLDPERLSRRMGLDRATLEIVVVTMTKKLAQLAEERDRLLSIDDHEVRLVRPPIVAQAQQAALAALEAAARTAPENIFVVEPLAELYYATGRLDDAAATYDRLASAARLRRELAAVTRLRQRQALVFETRGDLSAALAAYEEALEVDPSNIVTLSKLGHLYFQQADWTKARRIYQTIAYQCSFHGSPQAEAYLALGEVNLKLGDTPEAKAALETGLRVAPDNAKLKEALLCLEE